jgi:hypothetical protein
MVAILLATLWFIGTKNKQERIEFIRSSAEWIAEDGVSTFFWYEADIIIGAVLGFGSFYGMLRDWSTPSLQNETEFVNNGDPERVHLVEEEGN